MTEDRTDDDLRLSADQPPPPAPARAAFFVLCLLLLLGGFALMALGVDSGSGPVFVGGILTSGLAFFLPLTRTG
jgi:hypothetical protein